MYMLKVGLNNLRKRVYSMINLIAVAEMIKEKRYTELVNILRLGDELERLSNERQAIKHNRVVASNL